MILHQQPLSDDEFVAQLRRRKSGRSLAVVASVLYLVFVTAVAIWILHGVDRLFDGTIIPRAPGYYGFTIGSMFGFTCGFLVYKSWRVLIDLWEVGQVSRTERLLLQCYDAREAAPRARGAA